MNCCDISTFTKLFWEILTISCTCTIHISLYDKYYWDCVGKSKSKYSFPLLILFERRDALKPVNARQRSYFLDEQTWHCNQQIKKLISHDIMLDYPDFDVRFYSNTETNTQQLGTVIATIWTFSFKIGLSRKWRTKPLNKNHSKPWKVNADCGVGPKAIAALLSHLMDHSQILNLIYFMMTLHCLNYYQAVSILGLEAFIQQLLEENPRLHSKNSEFEAKENCQV